MKIRRKQGDRRLERSRRLVSAGSGVTSKAQSTEALPHLDFLKRFKGTLHETIVQSDLATLNPGLTFLFARLRQARQQYDEDTDGGRVGAFMALGAMWQFVALFNSSQAELLHLPALKLMDALAALDQNNVLPILKPVKRRGRAPSSHASASLQGNTAGTVTRLRASGLNPEEAYKLVAKELIKLGARSGRGMGKITADTVRHWCDGVASDVSRLGTAAMMYDSMFTIEENRKFQALSPAEARCFALASLHGYVRNMFPELRTPAKKPS
jgi:hypothetical protein